MRGLSRVDWLVAREILSLALVIIAVLSSVMFVFRIFAFADYVFMSQDGLATVLLFIVFLSPTIFKLTVPLSLLLASLMVTLRMSQDREIEALMACGASVLRIARAPTLLGLLAMVLSLYTGFFLEPVSREQLSRFKWMQAVRGIENFVESRLAEKTFLTDIFPLDGLKVSLFVENLTSGSKGDMEGVLLTIANPKSPGQDEIVLVASKGSIRKEMDKRFPDYVFRVQDGRIYQPVAAETKAEDRGASNVEAPRPERSGFVGPLTLETEQLLARAGDWDVFRFGELRLSIFSLFRRDSFSSDSGEVNIRTLKPSGYWAELKRRRKSSDWGRNKNYVRDHTYFYEAFAVPFACLFLPSIGICLGVSDPRRRPGHAYLGVGIFVFIFYATLMMCQQMALNYLVSPEVTLWLPPAVIMLMSGWVMRARVVYPPSASFGDMIRLDLQGSLRAVARCLGFRP